MNIPVSDIDFYSDEVIKDPYPVYAHLRELGPVVYMEKNDLFLVARYQEVSEVLLQPLRFVSSKGVSPIPRVNDILVGSTLNSDPPVHDKTRAVTSEPLLPGALVEIEPRLKLAADQLIETLCARGEFDAITDFAQYLPMTIVAELVGLPQAADSTQMLKWASAAFNLFGTENQRTQEAFVDLKDLRDFLLEYGRPEKLKEGGWAKRIFEVGPERGIPLETCAQLMRDYINPSLDTTISTTGQIIQFFADNPEQWKKLRADVTLIPNAVEEAVRLATPIRAFTRYAIEDIELSGHTIPEGKRVIVVYASANRDERKFSNADKFDVTRDVHDHVGFGQGVHMCMGMHLARREIILLLEALRRRVTRFEPLGEPVVAMNNTIRGYSKMPVKVHLAADLLDDFIADLDGIEFDCVAGLDAMGFVLGAGLAARMNKGFLPIRKAGKLCVDTDKVSFGNYSGRTQDMEMRTPAFAPGTRVLLADQWVETGGTMAGAIDLVERQQGVVAGLLAIAIEENDATNKYRSVYPCVSAVVPGSRWQTECNAQYLSSFATYDATRTFPNAGRTPAV